MTMDGCGNLYVVDQGNSDIYRILLDVDGALLGQPQSILEDPTPTIITSIRFGPGDGFDELSLFAAGSPGVVYRIETGVGMFGVD
jgi:CRP-like cAMP-binding protein